VGVFVMYSKATSSAFLCVFVEDRLIQITLQIKDIATKSKQLHESFWI